jgi:hypothetical protein
MVTRADHKPFLHHIFRGDPYHASAIPNWTAYFSANIEVSRRSFREFKLGLAMGVGYKEQVRSGRLGDQFSPCFFQCLFLSTDSRDRDLLLLYWAFICDIDDANRYCLAEAGRANARQKQ